MPMKYISLKTLRSYFLLILCLAILLSSSLLASDSESFGTVKVSEVTSVYDGDTFRVNLQDYPPLVGKRISVRVAGIDTPEMDDPNPSIQAKAQQAKQFTVEKLRGGKRIELRNMRRDKYFRILAEVWVDNTSLSDQLIKAGLAKPYFGGHKEKWL